MKICFVSETVDPSNGSGRFAFSMITRLQKDFGISPTILTFRGEKTCIAETKPILFANKILSFICNPFIIAWYGRKADHLHAFDGWPCLALTYLATILNKKKYSASLYGTYAVTPLTQPLKKYLLRHAYDHSDLNAAISNHTSARIREAYPAAHIEVINQGISFADYQTPRAPILPPNVPYILSVATMKRRKGVHIAIPAIAQVVKQIPNIQYVIVARQDPSSAYYKKILDMIRDYKLEDHIIWKQNLNENELIALYQHATVFFLASTSLHEKNYFEGFGSVNLEAQSCGTPVVASSGGGQIDALINNVSGYIFREEDSNDAAEKLISILKQPTLREKMSAAAIEFAKSLDWSIILHQYVDHWNKSNKINI